MGKRGIVSFISCFKDLLGLGLNSAKHSTAQVLERNNENVNNVEIISEARGKASIAESDYLV